MCTYMFCRFVQKSKKSEKVSGEVSNKLIACRCLKNGLRSEKKWQKSKNSFQNADTFSRKSATISVLGQLNRFLRSVKNKLTPFYTIWNGNLTQLRRMKSWQIRYTWYGIWKCVLPCLISFQGLLFISILKCLRANNFERYCKRHKYLPWKYSIITQVISRKW